MTIVAITENCCDHHHNTINQSIKQSNLRLIEYLWNRRRGVYK